MQRVGLLACLALPEQQQTLVAVSATECTDSASIDELPVIRKPMNFATAMPALAEQGRQDRPCAASSTCDR